MARTLNIRIVPDALLVQADRLEAALSRAQIALAAVDAVNTVTKRADESLREGEIADINLTDVYVRSKTDVALAVRSPRAEITVRGDLTILGRYPLRQLMQPAGPRSKGDPSRGIPAGSKQAGVQASIKRSGTPPQPKWFTMKLRRGKESGENVGVFVRVGPEKSAVKHIYGPAPYSLFRHQVGVQIEDIANDLQRTTDAKIAQRIERAL